MTAAPHRLLVTGGAGFIGANFIRQQLLDGPGLEMEPCALVCLDKLTYAGQRDNLAEVESHPAFTFVHGDIGDSAGVTSLLREHRITDVINFAAESHVDRSIASAEIFVRTNVLGTACLLEACRRYWQDLSALPKSSFRFLQVSTDEVFGSLAPKDPPFTEATTFAPNSPYAASKAGGDHFTRAYFQTYGLPVLTTHCSNNYGPYQNPEKLIPLITLAALAESPLPIYGDGAQIRTWLHVADHCRAVRLVLEHGRPGDSYVIGDDNELPNLELVRQITSILDRLQPRSGGRSYAELIAFVTDRPGHDRRYAVDAQKIRRELGWSPQENFADALQETIRWYLSHRDWVTAARSLSRI